MIKVNQEIQMKAGLAEINLSALKKYIGGSKENANRRNYLGIG